MRRSCGRRWITELWDLRDQVGDCLPTPSTGRKRTRSDVPPDLQLVGTGRRREELAMTESVHERQICKRFEIKSLEREVCTPLLTKCKGWSVKAASSVWLTVEVAAMDEEWEPESISPGQWRQQPKKSSSLKKNTNQQTYLFIYYWKDNFYSLHV